MDRWNNRVAVVTGAGRGIGKVIALDLATAGLRVVALDCRYELLVENHSKLPTKLQSRFYNRHCDVTNEAEVKATFEWIEKNLGGTDILINNAGVFHFGNLVDMDTKLINQTIDTNVKGVIYCTQAAFKSMKKRNFNGHIVHNSSLCGHRVVAYGKNSFNVYPPTKFALNAINETIRNELINLGSKIKTTNISAGLVLTPIFPEEELKNLGQLLYSEDISQAVMYVLGTPPHVQVHDIIMHPIAFEKIK